jgi:hypothetical protein
MSLDALPAGVPPGRLVTPDPGSAEWSGGPVCWASQEPIPDAPQQWARLQAIQDHTGCDQSGSTPPSVDGGLAALWLGESAT